MAMLNIFEDDAFSVTSLSAALVRQPVVPSRLQQLGWFNESGINTLSMAMEEISGRVQLVPSAPRGAPGKQIHGSKRKLMDVRAVHLPQSASISADEVQGIRAFGSETEVQAVQNVVLQRAAQARINNDVTMEWMRAGAVKGIVVDADGTTQLWNMYDIMGVSKVTFDMALSSSTTDVRKKTVQLSRLMSDTLGGTAPFNGIHVLCGKDFMDALAGHPDVQERWRLYQDGAKNREDYRNAFSFGNGIVFEEFYYNVNGASLIADNKAHAVPMGIPSLFQTKFAPANYMETVNTMGLPYYIKQERMPMDKGIELEVQSNPLVICTLPEAIIELSL